MFLQRKKNKFALMFAVRKLLLFTIYLKSESKKRNNPEEISMKNVCTKRKVVPYKYLRKFLDARYAKRALIFRREILNRRFRLELETVLRLILHTPSSIACQLVHRQPFNERPYLLDFASPSFPLALAVRYLGIWG